MPPPDEVPAVTDDVQCAYYAIERFRATWQITHVSGIFLTANLLNLLWYDPQGCIESSSLDIVGQLPLLVLLVTLQQRGGFWFGWPETKIPDNYHTVHKCAPRFQLVGRMTSCADLTTTTAMDSAAGASGTREAKHYFKSSWPEDDRPKEGHIIDTAKARVHQFLPTSIQPFVINHLPQVDTTNVVPGTCTAIIRALLGLSTKGSRTQYLMVSKKLSSVRTVVHEYESFKRVFLQIIRAHRLLWVLGIAHSDISFHNMMVDGDRGILNDFDLASIMEPGATSPPKTGQGTPMFMALEQLSEDGVKGLVPRVYRHELESFAWAWVLLYATLCHVVGGKENLDVPPFRAWVGCTSVELGTYKAGFLWHPMMPDIISQRVKGPYLTPLKSTIGFWLDLVSKQIQTRFKRTQALFPSDEALLIKIFDAWDYEPAEWMNFKILPEDTLKPTMPPSTGSTIHAAENLVVEPSTTNFFKTSGPSLAYTVDQSQGTDEYDDSADIYGIE